jgi:thymidine phosphorylase
MVVHDADDIVRLGAVAAEQTVVAEQPQITGARDGIGRRFGNYVLADEAIALVERRQQPIELLLVEAGVALISQELRTATST